MPVEVEIDAMEATRYDAEFTEHMRQSSLKSMKNLSESSSTYSTEGSSLSSDLKHDYTQDKVVTDSFGMIDAVTSPNQKVRETMTNVALHDLAHQGGGVRDSLLHRPTEALGQVDPSFHDIKQAPSFRRKDTMGLSPLLIAARAGNATEVNALLVLPSTDVLRRDPVYGQSALHIAVRGGHMGVLLALCAPHVVQSLINLPDNRRNTALHLAAAKSRRITKLLLDNGADVAFLNMRNQTALGVHILTTTKDNPVMTEMLLRYKADANAPVDQSTVLHVAIDKKLFEIATRLVRHGARLDKKDENGKMVFDKVDKTMLQKFLTKVNHSPVWIEDKERSNCMLCSKKFGAFGPRRHHCRFCGRLCCSECAHLTVPAFKFPKGFQNRTKKKSSTPNHEGQRVCKTCHSVLMEQEKDKGEEGSERGSDLAPDQFYNRVMNVEWDEVKGQANHPVNPMRLGGKD